MLKSEAAYAGYVHQSPKTNWSSEKEVRSTLEFVRFDDDRPIRAGGIPIISNGRTGYVDTSDNHCVIYGASGFKKSLVVFMQLICTLAKAGENMFVTDPKGELYARTALYLRKMGYHIRVVNFRDFEGEGFNPLHYPHQLYLHGERDKAALAISELIASLAQRQDECRTIDPFWPDTAKSYNSGVIPLMFSAYRDPAAINFLNLSDYYTESTADRLKMFLMHCDARNTSTANLNAVLSEPDKTRMSTLSTCSSFIQPFIQNDKLARMISRSTFELEEMAQDRTAIFLIMDDTSTVCNPIAASLISQLQTYLIGKAFESAGGRLKTRVNFVLDEFCAFTIPNMAEALATHRSRNIRYYLCVQSLDLLERRYQNYRSLLVNCATTLFLGSTEMSLLEDICKRCGTTTVTPTGAEEPLISIPQLMTLRKSWDSKELLYLNLASGIRFCTTLPAIEAYRAFSQYGIAPLPQNEHPPVVIYTLRDLINDISDKNAHFPFED